MTDRVEMSPGTVASHPHAGGHRYGIGAGFVCRGSEREQYYAEYHPDIDETSMASFSELTEQRDGHTATISGGEAFAGGRWLARDTQSTVDLEADTANQIVYVGSPAQSGDTVIVGLASEFPSAHSKIPIHAFDTDADGITDYEELRVLDPPIDVDETGDVTMPGGISVADGWIRTDRGESDRPHLGVGSPGSEAIWMSTTEEGDVAWLAPRLPGESGGGNQLRFYYDDELPAGGYWAFRRGLTIENQPLDLTDQALQNVGSIESDDDTPPTLQDGADLSDRIESTVESLVARYQTTAGPNQFDTLWSSTGDRIVYRPIADGDALTRQQFQFNFSEERWEFRDGFSAQGSEIENVNSDGENAVSSADVTKIIVSDSEPDESEPHLWLQPE